jgi:hypothetical protein
LPSPARRGPATAGTPVRSRLSARGPAGWRPAGLHASGSPSTATHACQESQGGPTVKLERHSAGRLAGPCCRPARPHARASRLPDGAVPPPPPACPVWGLSPCTPGGGAPRACHPRCKLEGPRKTTQTTGRQAVAPAHACQEGASPPPPFCPTHLRRVLYTGRPATSARQLRTPSLGWRTRGCLGPPAPVLRVGLPGGSPHRSRSPHKKVQLHRFNCLITYSPATWLATVVAAHCSGANPAALGSQGTRQHFHPSAGSGASAGAMNRLLSLAFILGGQGGGVSCARAAQS